MDYIEYILQLHACLQDKDDFPLLCLSEANVRYLTYTRKSNANVK